MIAKQYAYAPTAKTSLPRRDKLNESSTLRKKKEDNRSCLQFCGEYWIRTSGYLTISAV